MLALFQMRHSRTLPRMRHVRKGDAVSRMDAGRIDHETSRISGVARCSGRITAGQGASGQTLVEFAFIIPIFLLLMLGVVQMVVVGGAALAVNQAARSCARCASLNPSATQGTVASYLSGTASPLINDSGLQPLTAHAGRGAASDRRRGGGDSQLQSQDQVISRHHIFRRHLSKSAFDYTDHDQRIEARAQERRVPVSRRGNDSSTQRPQHRPA
jgi:hypothetical protein